jgi:sugar phosphate isomerase/epimerase
MRTVLHTYGLREYPLRQVLQTAAADGWTAVELSSWHIDPKFRRRHVRRSLATAAEFGRRHGVEIYSAGYWAVFTSPDARNRQRWVERVCLLIDACAEHGVTLVNGAGGWLVRDGDWDQDWRRNGSALAGPEELRWVADCYRQVAAYGARRGVRVAVEVHPNTVHDTVAATARLLDVIDHDNVWVALDPANAAALSEADRHPAVIDLVADKVVCYHLKNCRIRPGRSDFTVDTADGDLDNHAWLARLTRMPQVTGVCVEYCGDGDPYPRLAAARRYLDDTLRRIAGENA